MGEPKTKPTSASVDDFLAAVENPRRRADGQAACALLREVTGEDPVMWGPSIVGFGSYEGATGSWPRSGFSPRKAELVFYLVPGYETEKAEALARLGPHRHGLSCLYLKTLANVDGEALRELLQWNVETMRARYPAP